MSKIDEEALYRAVNNWESTAPVNLLLDMNAYKSYFLNERGIKVGSLLEKDHTVVDEKKYLMFLLRWS